MALDPDFVADCLYGEGGLLLDEILEVDVEASRIRARMPTHAGLPLTEHQRVDPVLHPRHVSGGLMVHMTGVAGFVHFYYILGLRHADGWTGYGAKIHKARFKKLAEPGAPLELMCQATRVRKIRQTINVRYNFEFTQDGALVYQGDQTAMWLKAR